MWIKEKLLSVNLFSQNQHPAFQNAEAILRGVQPAVMRQCHVEMYRNYVTGKILHHGMSPSGNRCELQFCKVQEADAGVTQCDVCDRWCHLACCEMAERPDPFHCLNCIWIMSNCYKIHCSYPMLGVMIGYLAHVWAFCHQSVERNLST